MENGRAKGKEKGGKMAFIEVYREIEYNRYSFNKLLNKFVIRVLENFRKLEKFKNV